MNIAMSWSLIPFGGLLGGLAVTAFGLSPALLADRRGVLRDHDGAGRAAAVARDRQAHRRWRNASRSAPRNGPGHVDDPVVGLGLADADPDAVAGERPDRRRRPRARRRRSPRPGRPAGTTRSCPGPPGSSQPSSRRAATDPGALGDQRLDPLEQLRLGREGRDRRGLGDARDAERQRHRAQRAGHVLVRDGVPDPEARPARRPWRTSASRRRWRSRGARARPSTASSIRTNSTYASSTTTSTCDGTCARKSSSALWVTDGPVGLFGVQTMTTLVRSVTAAAIASRSCSPVAVTGTCTDVGGRRGDRDRVGLEGPPRVDDLVAGVAERLQDLVDQRHRAGRRRQVRGGYAEARGQRVVQRRGAHVRVAVHLLDHRGRRLDHARQRRVGVLVRAELVRRQAGPRGRRLARHVGGDLPDVLAGGRGAGHAPQSRRDHARLVIPVTRPSHRSPASGHFGSGVDVLLSLPHWKPMITAVMTRRHV